MIRTLENPPRVGEGNARFILVHGQTPVVRMPLALIKTRVKLLILEDPADGINEARRARA